MADFRPAGLTRQVAPVAQALVGGALLVLCQGCPTGAAPPRPRPLGGLVVRCQPADAMIYVDDHLEGSASSFGQRPLALPLGFHRVEIRRDGYYPYFAEVTVVEGVRQQLEVQLRREPF